MSRTVLLTPLRHTLAARTTTSIPIRLTLPGLPIRSFSSTSFKMADKYSQTVGESVPVSQKLADAKAFLGNHNVLLTTRSPSGSLHARTMAIAEITKDFDIRFIYDNESYKEQEVENDNHVNIAADGSDSSKNDGWISIAGRASKTNDEGLVAKLYNPTLKAWFGDKGDGVHTGEPSDPRMAVLTIKIDEIRHFHQVKTSIGTVVDIVKSTVTGDIAKPGEIRTITGEEIRSAASKGDL